LAEVDLNIDNALRLAEQYRAVGNLPVAEYICRKVLQADPDQPDALRLLQLLAKPAGKIQGNDPAPDEQMAAKLRAIAGDPDNPRLRVELGDLLADRGRPAAAIAAYSESIRRFPNFAPAYSRRALLFAEHHLLDEALSDHHKAVELAPLEPAYQLDLAKTLGSAGNVSGAEQCCRRALELDAGSADAWDCLGAALQTNGKFDEAAAMFRRSNEIRPRAATVLRIGMTGRVPDTEQATRLAELLDDPRASPDDRIPAGFALGKMLDEGGRFDEAFAAYSGANSLFKENALRQGLRFDIEDLRRNIREIVEPFNPAFFRERLGWGTESELPVFIVGMPRSGTSLVEQIVSSHSKVFAGGERHEIAMLRSRLTPPDRVESPREWDRSTISREADGLLRKLSALDGEAERITDKMPSNLLLLGLIATLFPQARVIFCRRDPRDVCLSCFFQLFARTNHLFSYDLADCGRQYALYEQVTDHWRRTLPLRTLFVQYEDLVADVEGQGRRLIDFLGLPWEPRCLEFHQNRRPVLTQSVWQVRQPIYDRSVGRWRHYEKHLGSLQSALDRTPAIVQG
jgi:tetratricopeptide (TPR) repeat protein